MSEPRRRARTRWKTDRAALLHGSWPGPEILERIPAHSWGALRPTEVHYRRALLSAEPRGMRPNVAQCHLGLGKLY